MKRTKGACNQSESVQDWGIEEGGIPDYKQAPVYWGEEPSKEVKDWILLISAIVSAVAAIVSLF